MFWILLNSIQFRFSHTYREGNRCGDSLAVYGLRTLAFTDWDGVLPFIVSVFCRFDLPH